MDRSTDSTVATSCLVCATVVGGGAGLWQATSAASRSAPTAADSLDGDLMRAAPFFGFGAGQTAQHSRRTHHHIPSKGSSGIRQTEAPSFQDCHNAIGAANPCSPARDRRVFQQSRSEATLQIGTVLATNSPEWKVARSNVAAHQAALGVFQQYREPRLISPCRDPMGDG